MVTTYQEVQGRLLKSLTKDDSKQVFPLPTPTKSFSDSVEGYKEDFRPTTPGNSPGSGHSFAEDDEDTVEQKPGSFSLQGNDKYSIAGAKDDDQVIESKPPSNSTKGNGEHSIAGHSPGVGHAYPNQNSEKLNQMQKLP
uniref:Uncharacterized protein n=1 Tax=Gossypium raimondii TaxID=29730 RepID=A0A0D2NV77_GOSRA|nr:hypothetical protein B456_003G022100 [Gossypium raimondii]